MTLARKGARRFLTVAVGELEVDVRKLGRVLEDGNVTWHTEKPHGRFAETSSRGGTGHPSQEGCAKVPHRCKG